jgi:hypothetical protein
MKTFNPFTMQETENNLFSLKNNHYFAKHEVKKVNHDLTSPSEVLKYKISREKKRAVIKQSYKVY